MKPKQISVKLNNSIVTVNRKYLTLILINFDTRHELKHVQKQFVVNSFVKLMVNA